MKKSITLCLIACAIGIAGYAQQPSHAAIKARVDMLHSLTPRNAMTNAKTTATTQRLIGSARIDQTNITDSAVYYYSFGRGSAFDFDLLTYIAARPFPYIQHTGVMYDSCHKEVGAGSTSIKYAAGNFPASYHYYVMGPNTRETYSYDAQQQLVEVLTESYSSATMVWSPNFRTKYVYAGGRLVADTTEHHPSGSWLTTNRTDYRYNTAGQLDTAVSYQYASLTWIPFNKYRITYNGQYPVTTVYEIHNGISWDNINKVEKTFAANQKISELWYQWNSGSWVQQSEEYRHLNSNNLPDSIFSIDPVWDTTIVKLTYNSFNNPVTLDRYVSSLNATEQERFWYQEYEPTGVSDAVVPARLTLYPNPAREQIHILMDKQKEGSVVYIVVNKLGQTVLSGNASLDNYKLTLDTHNLSTGMYWLQLRGKDGEKYISGFVIE